MKDIIRNLSKSLENYSSRLQQVYQLHRSSVFDKDTKHRKATWSKGCHTHSKTNSVLGPLYTAVHSLDLHLQSALQKSRRLEDFLHDLCPEASGDWSDLGDIQVHLASDLEMVRSELDACQECCEEVANRIEKAHHKQPTSPDADIKVKESTSPQIGEPVAIFDLGEPIIQDQVFEAYTDPAEIGPNDWEYEPVVSDEERKRKKREKQEAVRLLKELKSVISVRKTEMDAREKVALDRSQQEPKEERWALQGEKSNSFENLEEKQDPCQLASLESELKYNIQDNDIDDSNCQKTSFVEKDISAEVSNEKDSPWIDSIATTETETTAKELLKSDMDVVEPLADSYLNLKDIYPSDIKTNIMHLKSDVQGAKTKSVHDASITLDSFNEASKPEETVGDLKQISLLPETLEKSSRLNNEYNELKCNELLCDHVEKSDSATFVAAYFPDNDNGSSVNMRRTAEEFSLEQSTLSDVHDDNFVFVTGTHEKVPESVILPDKSNYSNEPSSAMKALDIVQSTSDRSLDLESTGIPFQDEFLPVDNTQTDDSQQTQKDEINKVAMEALKEKYARQCGVSMAFSANVAVLAAARSHEIGLNEEEMFGDSSSDSEVDGGATD